MLSVDRRPPPWGSLTTIHEAHEVKTNKNTKMLFAFAFSFYHKYTVLIRGYMVCDVMALKFNGLYICTSLYFLKRFYLFTFRWEGREKNFDV